MDLRHRVCIGIESNGNTVACHAVAKRQPTVTEADVRRRGTMPLLFQNFLCSLFLFAFPQKKKKRDISFENEEGMKGNARNCLYSEKVECLHGNIGGVDAHGLHRY